MKYLFLLLVWGVYTMSAAAPQDTSVIKLDNGAIGVMSTFSYVWIIPGHSGVILVDAGNDPAAQKVITQLKLLGKTAADVKGILITHGHGDHVAGIAAFANADVFIMADDSSMLKKKPARLKIITSKELVIDSQKINVFPLPGHTGGSTAFIWNTTCWTGDVLTRNNGQIAYGPDHYSASPEQNRESVKSLLTIEFKTLATGHGGLITRTELKEFLK